jgi:hypothetical protein
LPAIAMIAFPRCRGRTDRSGAEDWLRQKIGDAAEYAEVQIAHNYRFKCPACQYDWSAWRGPSIVFVSLSFVTDQCPNCQKKRVPACLVEAD